MKFNFRLEALMRQRKADRDNAQRIYADAQDSVQRQLAMIKRMYAEIDKARLICDETQAQKGTSSTSLANIDEFIEGQKIRIKMAREKARELMSIAEEKLEILTDKMRDYKMLEKLKERQHVQFKNEKSKKEIKELDDITIMRAHQRGEV